MKRLMHIREISLKVVQALKVQWHYYCIILFPALKRNPFTATMIAGSSLIVLLILTLPSKSPIIPMGKEMTQAYELLKSTESGRHLIKKVENNTKGTFIYLMLGTTEKNNLSDYSGRKVRGITRAYYKSIYNTYTPQGIFVFTNKDVTSGNPEEIVKSIAFELENVVYSAKYPAIEFGKDSPHAPVTQKMVCMELGL